MHIVCEQLSISGERGEPREGARASGNAASRSRVSLRVSLTRDSSRLPQNGELVHSQVNTRHVFFVRR